MQSWRQSGVFQEAPLFLKRGLGEAADLTKETSLKSELEAELREARVGAASLRDLRGQFARRRQTASFLVEARWW